MALTAKKVYAILKRQISDMEAKLNSPVRYRGTVATADLLPLNPDIGDMYNIESKSVYGEAGMNVAWNGVVWDTMGAPIDMSLYIKSSELADWVKQQNKPTYTAEEVGALPADTKIPSKTSDLQNDSGFLTKIPDNYLSGTDKTLNASGKAADAKATGDKITELSADISNKLNKNQGSENSGKIAGINESGDIVPMFPVSVDYNEETNYLEFGSDQKMELNKGINLDSTLTKTGYAADAGVVGKITNSLKEDLSTKITKFYASSQGETHLADSDNGKITDMVLYGRSEQKQYSGKNLLNPTLQTTIKNGVTCTANGDGTYTLNGTTTTTTVFDIAQDVSYSSFRLAGCPVGGAHDTSYELQARTDNLIYGYDTGDGKNIKANENFFIRIRINTGINCNNLLFKPMIVDASLYPDATYDDFEPYTGGIPSPNPDYPQEIKSVVNPTVKVCGKNLLNYDAWSQIDCANGKAVYENNGVTITALRNDAFTNYDMSKFPTTARIPVNVGETITISWDEPLNKEGRVYVFGNASTSNMTYVNNSSSKQLKYTIPSGVTFITFRFGVGNAGDTISYRNIQIELGSTPTAYEPYHEQTVTLPYTLNAIPVSSGGNVTINGQQYVSDYVDVERGKLVRMVGECVISDMNQITRITTNTFFVYGMDDVFVISDNSDDIARLQTTKYQGVALVDRTDNKYIYRCWLSTHDNLKPIAFHSNTDDLSAFKNEVYGTRIIYQLANPTEIDLTPEEIAAFKSLATYYPVTNIFINSEQLDGYTVFNYPVSMENGWNYVKQQIGDTRNYIYDMDARAQDTDLQAAEAYVNSEYAVALTELEV